MNLESASEIIRILLNELTDTQREAALNAIQSEWCMGCGQNQKEHKAKYGRLCQCQNDE